MIRWLEEAGGGEKDEIGKKAAALAELQKKGMEVPKGFAVTLSAWRQFIEYNGIEDRIEKHLDQADKDDMDSMKRASERIQSMIKSGELPEQLEDDIKQAYSDISLSKKVRNAPDQAAELIGGQRELEFVAVRQSRIEDISDLNTADLNIHGKSRLVESVKDAWANVYSPEAIKTALEEGKKLDSAVLVQRMVDADHSAIVLTADPSTTEEEIIIEAVHGIGRPLSLGSVVPERYRVDKTSGRLEEHREGLTGWKLSTNPRTGQLEKKRLSSDERNEQTLTHSRITDLANLGLELENIAGGYIKACIALDGGKMQVITAKKVETGKNSHTGGLDTQPLAQGTSVSSGTISGEASRIKSNDKEASTSIAISDDLDVSGKLEAEEIDSLKGLIAEKGSIGSKTAEFLRSRGKPALIDVENLEEFEGREIHVDGFRGIIDEGSDQKIGENDLAARPVDSLTGTRILTLEQVVEGSDGSVSLTNQRHPGGNHDWSVGSGEPVSRIYRRVKERFDGGAYLVDGYSDLLKIEEVLERGAGHVILDMEMLQEKDSGTAVKALEEAARKAGRENVSAVIKRPVQKTIDAVIHVGVESVIVPPEDFQEFRKRIDRAERRFIMDGLRDRLYENQSGKDTAVRA
ncbi:MAG: PEP/pyruvate-binding domain-containing protein [Candidatus Nanohaloarchaea archaeon]|nr:PEP/pyruvate-binding domain-containing protein [Candidatus Nanohaloarchaea archaeon]